MRGSDPGVQRVQHVCLRGVRPQLPDDGVELLHLVPDGEGLRRLLGPLAEARDVPSLTGGASRNASRGER